MRGDNGRRISRRYLIIETDLSIIVGWNTTRIIFDTRSTCSVSYVHDTFAFTHVSLSAGNYQYLKRYCAVKYIQIIQIIQYSQYLVFILIYSHGKT